MISLRCLSGGLRHALPGLLSAAVLTGGVAAHAQDKPTATKKPAAALTEKSEEETKDPYEVPEGTPEEILEFIEELQEDRPRFKSREEMIQHVVKVQKATITAGDRLLADKDVDEETAAEAAELKLQAHFLLTRVGLDGAQDEAEQAARKLAKDPRKAVAQKATEMLTVIRIASAPALPVEQREALSKELLDGVVAGEYSNEALGPAFMLVEVLQQMEDTQPAADYLGKLAELLAKSDKPQLQEQSKALEGMVRRLQLPGNAMEVKGTTLAGEPLDWESYRGKVVLVDFWATWCGPCIAELPNVKKQYAKYHSKGFDVVGISLDDDREKLEKFIEKNDIPWTTLFETEAEQQGWSNPLARYYSVQGIPTAILVDKEGKVVAMEARGPELAALLEKLLGPAEEPADEEPLPKKSNLKIRSK